MGLYRGGRPKGTKNKSTDLHAKCREVKLDVFERLLELAMQEHGKPSEWSKLSQLAQYLYARPKDTGEIQLGPEEIREMIRQWTKESNVQSIGS